MRFPIAIKKILIIAKLAIKPGLCVFRDLNFRCMMDSDTNTSVFTNNSSICWPPSDFVNKSAGCALRFNIFEIEGVLLV